MKHPFLMLGSLATLFVASLSAAPAAGGQVVKRDTVPRAAQKPAVRQASVDSLVECSPVVTPARKKPVVRRRATPARKKAAPAAVHKPAPKKAAAKPRGPVIHRARRVAAKPAKAAPAHSTTVVMCRPVRPLPALAQGTPTEQSVVPVPQLASAAPAPAQEVGPPLFVSTAPGMPIAAAGGGSSWLPFAIVPAIFVPFIHSGGTHHGRPTPIDTLPSKPPVDTIPIDTIPVDTLPTPPIDTLPTPPIDTLPVPPIDTLPGSPPTTVPEPGSLALVATGLVGLGGVMRRKRKR
jgi:PEP-CTERM motif-containing protein